MLFVSKERAGSSSHGHVWVRDHMVVQVPDEDAYELVAIPDGGFSIVEDPVTADPRPSADVPPAEDRVEVDEAPRPARRGRRPRTDTDDPEIHEG